MSVAAKQGKKRVFWVMTGACDDKTTLYSGEKPFPGALDTRLELTAADGTKYVTAAYLIPDPVN